MDYQMLKDVCSKIEDNTQSKVGACTVCVKIVIDYHDSCAGNCESCGKYFCADCATYSWVGKGLCKKCRKKG